MLRYMGLIFVWLLLSPAYAGDAIKIVVFGDSLVAGYGLPPEEAFPAMLHTALRQKGYAVDVINAGVSGDTTAGGKGRVKQALALRPDIVVLALGANDMLRGIDPEITRENLDAIIRSLKKDDSIVVLSGMKAALNMGPRFAGKFNAIYPALAETHNLIYQPFFLEGVAAKRTFNQPDGMHPNREGVAIMVKQAMPYVERAVKAHKKHTEKARKNY